MAQKRRGKMTRKQRQRQLHRRMFLTGVLVVLICVGIYSGIRCVAKTASDITAVDYSGSDYEDNDITDWTGAPPIDVELLTPNSWSRPQTRLKKVDGIVIHYTANPGSTAMQNRDYFENLPETQEAQASSHFVVGIEGEVVQCIPTSEWSYASNQRNFDTISIECCHPDDSGEFTDETYNSVVQLAGFLCKRFNLTSDDVIRHYDVTEKLCPLYYVEHEDAWIQMKARPRGRGRAREERAGAFQAFLGGIVRGGERGASPSQTGPSRVEDGGGRGRPHQAFGGERYHLADPSGAGDGRGGRGTLAGATGQIPFATCGD